MYVLMSGLTLFLNIFGGQGLYPSEDEAVLQKRATFNSIEHDSDALTRMQSKDGKPPVCMVPKGPAIFLCIVGFLGCFGEAAMVAWCIIFFKEDLSASSVDSTVGFSIFYTFMGLGRFGCDRIRQFIGRQRLIFLAGVLAFLGMSFVVASPSIESTKGSIILACFGCVFSGSGISTIVPTVFSTAGRLPGQHSGTAIATVAFLTYSGSIVSPMLVGGLSDAISSLRWALMIDGVLLLLMTPLSFGIPHEPSLMDDSYDVALLADKDEDGNEFIA